MAEVWKHHVYNFVNIVYVDGSIYNYNADTTSVIHLMLYYVIITMIQEI